MPQEINSLANEKIKKIAKILEKGSVRRQESLLAVETERDLRLALAAGYELEVVYIKKKNLAGIEDLKISDNKTFLLSEDIFNKLAYRENPTGILAVFKSREIKLEKVELRNNPLVFILESVEKPGNVGAILRTADAVRADLVIINDLKTDIYNPNIIRSSLGAVFSVPIVNLSLPETIKWLKEKKIKSLAAALPAKKYYTEINWCQPLAIVLGAEHDGLSESWLKAADELIKIPMRGKMDSLNVSVSAAILAFEADRQRHLIA